MSDRNTEEFVLGVEADSPYLTAAELAGDPGPLSGWRSVVEQAFEAVDLITHS